MDDDIFAEASASASDKLKPMVSFVNPNSVTEVVVSDSFVDVGVDSWDDLKDAFDKCYVKRFHEILMKLPDREYVKIFPKIVPFFVAKEGVKADKGDTFSQISINVNK